MLLLPALAVLVVGVSSCSASDGAVTSASPSSSSTLAQSPAASGAPASGKYPNAIAVLGHSRTTGYNSDPSSPGTDTKANSWATGDNPAVQSIYTRLLAVNPAVAGHNANLGVDGSDVNGLSAQVDQALALDPKPELFMIQEVDNDLQCDGTDKDNYGRFARTLGDQLTRIMTAVPRPTSCS